MDAGTLITPRRNFLIRALGFTASGATLAVPIVTIASPEERARIHYAEFAKAMDELTVGTNGWNLQAGRRDAVNSFSAVRWARLDTLHHEPDDEPGYGHVMVERHHDCWLRLA